jgi:hypothetical protein
MGEIARNRKHCENAASAGARTIAITAGIAKESKLEFKHSALSSQQSARAKSRKTGRNAVSLGHVRFCRKKFLLALA